jgi:hypothetical protein
MPQEKLNNQTLRSKLADLVSLPGEELQDKAAAWSTLHDRLRKKPRRINPLWYWAAAALIIACSLPFIITKKKAEEIVKADATEKIQQPIKADTNKPVEMPIVISTPGTLNQKATQIIKPNNHIEIKDTGSNNNTIAIVPEIIVPQQEVIQQPVAENPQPVIAATPAKKKLRVVSINELYTPEQESLIASSLPPAIVTKKFYNMPTTTPPVQEYAGVLKIKISLKH